MASAPFPGSWSGLAAFTGNSDFVIDTNGIIWLIGESTSTGAAIYNSTNQGIAFNEVTTIPNVASSGLAFDPAVALDASGNLHFVGQVKAENGTVSLLKYEWNTTTSTLLGPFSLAVGGLIGSDYDIVALSNGDCYVVVCYLSGSQEQIKGFEIGPTGSIVYTDALVTQGFQVGNRYGSVSLYTPDGATVEIYLESHSKVYSVNGMMSTISLITRTAPDTLSSASSLTTFPIVYIDPDLTVIGNGVSRYLSIGYYTQSGSQLVGNMLLGALTTSGGTWSFQSFLGTPASSLSQPTLSISPAGLVLAFINQKYSSTPAPGDAPISIYTLIPATWSFTPRIDFPYQASASWLRGTRSMLPSNMPWGFLAQQAATNQARFYTGYNPPPTVVVSPNTLTALRGTTYQFDASGSFSPNLDVLHFSWQITDPTGQAIFTPEGEQATLMLPKSAGPDAFTIIVTVSVTAYDSSGDLLHTAVTANCSVSYPLVQPPVIESASAIAVARNTTVNYTPTVTDAAGYSLTYAWSQVSGTAVDMLSSPDVETLTFETNGAAVAGESLEFQLSASDGMNDAVIADFTFNVAARVADPDSLSWLRTTWPGTIAQRNTSNAWPTAIAQGQLSNFSTGKRGALIGGDNVFILISPFSVLIQIAQGTGTPLGTYRAFLPNTNDQILDADHADYNATVVLTQAGLIQQFLPNGSYTNTDDAAATLTLSSYTTKTYTSLLLTPSYGGVRVFILYGEQGAFLLEVNTYTLVVNSFLELSLESGFLYGADHVDFVRISDVESLRSGEVLVGTIDSNGNTYETQINLATRSIIGTWDSSMLINPDVTTGELLFQPVDSYAGQPLAPTLATPAPISGGYTLTWSQDRPDLVTGYYVFMGAGTATPTLYQTVNSGLISTIAITGLPKSSTWSVYVQAQSKDGPSPNSNTVQISF